MGPGSPFSHLVSWLCPITLGPLIPQPVGRGCSAHPSLSVSLLSFHLPRLFKFSCLLSLLPRSLLTIFPRQGGVEGVRERNDCGPYALMRRRFFQKSNSIDSIFIFLNFLMVAFFFLV